MPIIIIQIMKNLKNKIFWLSKKMLNYNSKIGYSLWGGPPHVSKTCSISTHYESFPTKFSGISILIKWSQFQNLGWLLLQLCFTKQSRSFLNFTNVFFDNFCTGFSDIFVNENKNKNRNYWFSFTWTRIQNENYLENVNII